ncbi:MAG: cysteine--tRNA ligase, partial [Planctomycetes bacterium]|nr:cysteine--tRNA ligase [Planctomycetota bacterium]
GMRGLAGKGKRHSGDFALWKSATAEETGWESPWGRGRPGWHIECSAMSMKYLGETFDIHGGGIDLIFPHHENEIAQSELATGKGFAKFWMHNGLTRLRTKAAGGQWRNEKMAKSLGNIRTIQELLEEYPGETLRFFLLSTHYRSPIDFTDESIEATQKGMMGFYRMLERVTRMSGDGADVYKKDFDLRNFESLEKADESDEAFIKQVREFHSAYFVALEDDFNTAKAISILFELCKRINHYMDSHESEGSQRIAIEASRMVTYLGQILGLFQGPLAQRESSDGLAEQLMQVLIGLRAQARQDKNFALSDAIRDRLKEIDLELEDLPDGTTVWNKNP